MACVCCETGRCCEDTDLCWQGWTRSMCSWRTSYGAKTEFTPGADCASKACIDPNGSANCELQTYCVCTKKLSRTFVASVSTCDCSTLVAAGYPTGGCATGLKCCPSGCLPRSPFSTNFSINVQNNSWVDTGVTLTAGQRIAITATATNDRGPAGTVEWAGIGSTATPNGVTSGPCNCCVGSSVASDSCHMALIGSVGSSAGPYFFVGSSYSGAPGAGRLYLRQNDTFVGDNRGYFNGTISGTTDPCPGYGPASVGEPRILQQPKTHGPGASLKGILARFGIVASPTCPCTARAAEMDSWGEWGCLARLPLIVDWLEEEAAKRGLRFFRPAGYALVLAAIALSALSRPWRGNN